MRTNHTEETIMDEPSRAKLERMKLDAEPELCYRCREVCGMYFERNEEGVAICCEVCGACVDFIYDED